MSMSVYKCMKYILIIFNTFMMLLGGVGLGLSIWALVSDFGATEIKSLTGSDVYEAACIAVIVASGIIFTLSFIGCCGAWFESRCLLGFYFVVMLLFLCIFVATAASIFYFGNELEDKLAADMERTLKFDYGNPKKSDITRVWNKMQQKLGCCGVRGGRSSAKSWYLWQNSYWHAEVIRKDNPGSELAVPMSCCVKDKSCQSFNQILNRAPQRNYSFVTEDNPDLNEDGCFDRLKAETNDYLMAIGITAVVIFIIMFFCVIFSVCVCTHSTDNRFDFVI